MDMTTKSCREFVAVLASNEPAPGGGGAAALVGAIGTALGNMVGSLTVGKKKYADVEAEIVALMKKCDALQAELLDQVPADAEGFVPLAKAYGIPKDDPNRAAVLEELNKDYVQGARARGIRESVILWKNVIKSAMLTIITLLALSIGSLLGGTAIIESIFMWDGVGKLAVDAITTRDYPVIQAYVVWMALIYVIVNLITDLLYHCLDPRIRLGVNQNG